MSQGDKADDVMASLASAITLQDDLPLSATVGEIDGPPNGDDPPEKIKALVLTARNKGSAGNECGLTPTITASGLTATLTPMSGGQGDPSLDAASALPNGELAAIYGAVMASESDPARPLNTLPLPGLDITSQDNWPGRTEQENALMNCLTPFEVDGGVVRIVRSVSTYAKNAAGVNDRSLMDITIIRSLDYVRLACRTRYTQRFPREKHHRCPTGPYPLRTARCAVFAGAVGDCGERRRAERPAQGHPQPSG